MEFIYPVSVVIFLFILCLFVIFIAKAPAVSERSLTMYTVVNVREREESPDKSRRRFEPREHGELTAPDRLLPLLRPVGDPAFQRRSSSASSRSLLQETRGKAAQVTPRQPED